MPYYTAIVTLLAVAFYFFLATRVAVARGKFDVKHPATTGNSDFERIFRVHMNTLEWMPTFLVPLWLCAISAAPLVAVPLVAAAPVAAAVPLVAAAQLVAVAQLAAAP